jgi:hypothetical protein
VRILQSSVGVRRRVSCFTPRAKSTLTHIKSPTAHCFKAARNAGTAAMSMTLICSGGRPPLRAARNWEGDLPTRSNQKSVHTESQRQTQAVRHLDSAGSRLHDSSNAGAGTDLRSRSSTRAVRVPPRAKRPTGGGRGGRAVVPWPSGSCRCQGWPFSLETFKASSKAPMKEETQPASSIHRAISPLRMDTHDHGAIPRDFV